MAVTSDFSASELNLNGLVDITSPTALVWGPDGRLYVTQQTGDVFAITVAFGDANPNDGDPGIGFYAAAVETILDVKAIPNHNDDGTSNNGNTRQVTGIDVTPQFDSNGQPVTINGKPAVVMYVTSSDNRIGAGTKKGDVDLDTNSSVITRLTQTETGWDVVDLIRGLPRSEENHAANGLEVIQEIDPQTGTLISERMIVASGGNANNGPPSVNFAYQQEMPYSAALLEIDLDRLNSEFAIKSDNGRAYIYDLPTLNDPFRAGANDGNDPFGGNDGVNSAKLIADSPVQLYSTGYRNAYDLEVTEDGRVFTYDNGANNGWGGRPAGEDEDGDLDSVEAENGTPAGYIATNLAVEDNNELIDDDPETTFNFNPQNWDQLHEATRSDDLAGRVLSAGKGGAQLYQWDHPDFEDPLQLVYGGHPNPTRAEGARAGLLSSPDGATVRLLVSNVEKPGGSSDFLEVVAWLSSIGYSESYINNTVMAVAPGTIYGDTLAGGFGGAGANGRPTTTGVFSLNADPSGPHALPADIDEIVDVLNPVEGNYLEAGFTDGALDTGKGSINGLAEYTSSIFDDAGQAGMQGALIAASLNQTQYYIIGRDMDSDGVVNTTTTTSGNSGFAGNRGRTIAADRDFVQSGGAPLGVATIGDDVAPYGGQDAFRGTVWGAIYKQNGPVIEIFQPGDAVDNPLLGADNYAGATATEQNDNDLDGINNLLDPFEFDADNGIDLAVGEEVLLTFSQVDLANNPDFSGTLGDTGLLGAALDGVTPNRDAITAADGGPASGFEDGLFDNAGNLILGGNAPLLNFKDVQNGTAIGTGNTLRDGLHTGVKLDPDVQRVVAQVDIVNWYNLQPGEGRITGVSLGDGTQSNFVRFVFGDIGDGTLGLEVGLETDDSYQTLASVTDPAFAAALTTGGDAANALNVSLQLEVADIGGDYTVKARYKVDGVTEFAEVNLSGAQLPVGVLRDVIDGTHQITDGATTVTSGLAVGVVVEKDNGVEFTSVDVDVIRVQAFGNEIIADTVAQAQAAGTSGEDTVIYTGPEGDIQLDPTVENFDGSGSSADWSLTGTPADNIITAGTGLNTITTGAGQDVVRGTREALDGDIITDFSVTDKVIVTDADLTDADNVIYQSGSAILNVNGTVITFDGPEFDGFDPTTGADRFAFADGAEGLEITLVADETVLYRVNAGGPTIAALDDGPVWQSDADFGTTDGPVTISGTTGAVSSPSITDEESDVTFSADVDPDVIPWELFVAERFDRNTDGVDLTYNFNVEVGKTYKITLYYTENWPGIFAADPRVFDVSVEGAVPDAFDDLHPILESARVVDGNPNAGIPDLGSATSAQKQPYIGVALQREFTYTATDGVLNLGLEQPDTSGLQNPKINAIQISEVSTASAAQDTTPPVVADIAVEDSLSDQDSDRLVTVTVTDETGLDVSLLQGLTGAELQFTGITPGAISAPDITLNASNTFATLVYSISPPLPAAAWPTGTFEVGVAAGTLADAAGNGAAAASFDFTFAEPDPPTSDDVTVGITGDANLAEGDGTASYTVTLSEAVTETTIITVNVTADTAAVPGDVAVTEPITLTFEPGAALSQVVQLDLVDDTLPELDEVYSVSVSGLPITAGNLGTVTTTIAANDGPVDSVNGTPTAGGDFSDDGLNPTQLGILDLGQTTLVASQQGDAQPGGRERDYATFTVAEGQVLSGITLEDWQTEEVGFPLAFIGLQAGAQVTVDPDTFANVGDLLGGHVYGFGDVASDVSDGNLLTADALGKGSEIGPGGTFIFGDGTGFDGPLGAGTYTLWLNQGGESSMATIGLITENAEGSVEPIRLEAEAATAFDGFSIMNDGTRIQLPKDGSGTATFDLSTIAAGSYQVRIGLWDENDGASTLGASILSGDGDQDLGSITLDDDATSSAIANDASFRLVTLPSLALIGAGTQLELAGMANAGERLRIDFIELVPVAPAENAAPTAVTVTPVAPTLPEDTDTTAPVKVADIAITDDGLGTNAISLAGAAASSFEVVGTELFLAAGVTLDFGTTPTLDVTVQVDDPTVGTGAFDVSTDFTLDISEASEPPTDPASVLEVLGIDDNDFDGTVQGETVDGTNDGGNDGSVVLTVLDGDDRIDASNFRTNAFQLTNTGTKEVAAVFVDIRGAVFADQVFDNDGTGGDTASSPFEIDTDAGTGAFFVGADGVAGNNDDNLFFEGDTPAPDTSGLSANGGTAPISGGYRGLLIRFDGSEGGFNGGETVGFSGDGDSNSIAGFQAGKLNPNNVTGEDFDTGGQSGAELIGSSFTVLFADGTTATGYLGSDTTQAGAAGEAVQGRAEKVATLTIDTGLGSFDSGDVGEYGGDVPTITVAGTPGDTVRVVLHKGFQPTNDALGGSPDTMDEVIQGRLDTLVPDFAVNNAFDVQTFDVTIGNNGQAVVPVDAFDYNTATSGISFAGDNVQPLAFTAAVVEQVSDNAAIIGNGATDLVPAGPVSQPIYLSNPTQTPVDDSGVVNPPSPTAGYFEVVGTGANQYFKIQMEDGSGGTNPDGKWSFISTADAAGNQSGFQGTGYYLYGDSSSNTVDRNNVGDEVLEYNILVDENSLGVYTFSFRVARDGAFDNDLQNDLWLNFKPADQEGLGDIEPYLTDTGGNAAHPHNNGFVKLFGGPNDGDWGTTGKIDGSPRNYEGRLNITEAGLYTIQIDGRSEGYHVDSFELYKGNNPSASAPGSNFVPGDPGTGGGGTGGGNGGGGTPVGDPIRLQAEDANSLTGNYKIQNNPAADEGQVIGVTGGDNATGGATYDLDAAGIAPGTYDITVGYFDENDGESTLTLDFGGDQRVVNFDEQTGSALADGISFREITLTDVLVDGGDILSLSALRDMAEPVRVDYFDFTPTDGGTGGGDTGGGDTGGGDTGGGDTGGGDTGGGDTGGGDTGGGTTPTELVVAVDASADDREEQGGAGSKDLEFGLNGSSPQSVGIRFDDIDIPAGATITEAFLRFEAYETSTGSAAFSIEIENSLNAQSYSTNDKSVDRAYADEFLWSNVETWVEGQTYRTPDISDLIEGLVGAGGGQDLALAFQISGAGSRVAHSFDSVGDAPELVILFEGDQVL